MKFEFDKISITATIAVVSLSIALLISLIVGANETVTISLASGLTGYIGGRVSNAKKEDDSCVK